MPGLDRTGPGGQGPMTGWGRGRCGRGRGAPDPYGRGFGYGGGRGFGRGRGWRGQGQWGRGPGYGRWDPYYGGGVDEKSDLEARAADIKRELKAIEQRLSEL